MSVPKRQCQQCSLNRPTTRYHTPNGRICIPCQKKTASRTTKNARLQLTYGITIEEYDQILEAQGGCCAICKGKRPIYDVDHDHKAEKSGIPIRQTVRGLLCRRCNRRLLPAAQDDPARLSAAIQFLSHPTAPTVIGGR